VLHTGSSLVRYSLLVILDFLMLYSIAVAGAQSGLVLEPPVQRLEVF
jgi:hypothetical protein